MKRMEEHIYKGIRYRARNGFIISILTPKGWRKVFNTSGVSEAIRLLFKGADVKLIFKCIEKKGNKI